MSAAPPLPQELRSRYQLLRLLGQGGFGSVLLCEDRHLGRQVALKLLHGSLDDPQQAKRFLREAQVTSRLQHPHIVTLYDHGLSPSTGQPWIAYEYVSGQDLDSLPVSDPWLRGEHLLELGAAICSALGAAHEVGVVHRDVKPANVLMRDRGEPVLCDFGIARLEDVGGAMTAEGILLGTPAFMAPEIWRGAPPGPASDQYAWAASLYQLRYGSTVLGVEEPGEILRALELGGEARIPPGEEGREPGLEAALLRALRRRPEERFPDMEAFARALTREATGNQIPRGPATRTTPLESSSGITRPVALASTGSGVGLASTRALPTPGPASPGGTRVHSAPPPSRRWLRLPLLALLLGGLGAGAWFRTAPDPPPGPPHLPGPGVGSDRGDPQVLPPDLEAISRELQERFQEDLDAPFRDEPSYEELVRVYPLLMDPDFPGQFNRLLREIGDWIRATPVEEQGPFFQQQIRRLLGHQALQITLQAKRIHQRLEKTVRAMKTFRALTNAPTEDGDVQVHEDWRLDDSVDLEALLLSESQILIQRVLLNFGPRDPPPPAWILEPLLDLAGNFNLGQMARFLEPLHESLLATRDPEAFETAMQAQYLILRRVHDAGRIPRELRCQVLFATQDFLEELPWEIPESLYVEAQGRLYAQIMATPFLYREADGTPMDAREVRRRLEPLHDFLEGAVEDHPDWVASLANQASLSQVQNVITERPDMADWLERARGLASRARSRLPPEVTPPKP